ncbi:receptor-like protein kinase THESEUS 1 [Rutidosis leptorrhynchoides]|uniref:receptor-like protein kinase THESEUS 1 n=1 Tax=Rutidosis leptorrhynchoides TaxID=125765 RepID=UPI003A997E12
MSYSKRFNLYALLHCLCIQYVICATNTHHIDSFLISCGQDNPVELEDGRVFESDLGNSHVSISPISNTTITNSEKGAPTILSSARVFTSSSIYTFSTKKIGRHWVRIHFYPLNNTKFDLSSAVFSVEANGITLIHEFSFFRGNKSYHLLKEYVIEVTGSNSGRLVLGLLPWDNSVAFINAIEILSVPDDQFSSKVIPIPLGLAHEFPTHVGFETVYRINMGGYSLPPNNDSFWRKWESDKSFLVNPAAVRNVSVNPNSIQYHDGVTSDIAPNWVYATADEMADANVNDQRFNISWRFEVEESFGYFIRLHFCDIVGSRLHDLVFNVYINNQSAIESLDVSQRAKGLSSAYFIDFFTNMSMGSDTILVQVGPNHLTGYLPTALLNGLEIMKMSNPSDSLDGKLAINFESNDKKKSKKIRPMIVILSCLGGGFLIVVVFLISLMFFLCCRHKKKPKKEENTRWSPIPTYVGNSATKFSSNTYGSTSASPSLGQTISFSEVREATKNFDKSLLIGAGGFGKVYQGVLANGLVVAVKRGNPSSQQGLVEFKTEIEMLSKLRHRHLVSLIGYCEELNEMILVYEFMAGGPLRRHLYGSNLPPLTWKQRLEILIGAAKGLHYLHTGVSETVIHRDVKTTNILLDENLEAKVADFGLSKFGPTLNQTHVSTAVKGSFGYLDPEYFRRQQLTEKSDVYSFGVVMLEVLCARPAINPTLPREQVNIAEWGMNWQKKGDLEKIMDQKLMGSVNLESLRKFSETAEKCLNENGNERPSMGDVLWNLEYALQLQEACNGNGDTNCGDGDSMRGISDIPDRIPDVESLDFESISDLESNGTMRD